MATVTSTLAADLGKDHVVRVMRFAEEDAAVIHIMRPGRPHGLATTFNMSLSEALALRDLLNCTYAQEKFPTDYAK